MRGTGFYILQGFLGCLCIDFYFLFFFNMPLSRWDGQHHRYALSVSMELILLLISC